MKSSSWTTLNSSTCLNSLPELSVSHPHITSAARNFQATEYQENPPPAPRILSGDDSSEKRENAIKSRFFIAREPQSSPGLSWRIRDRADSVRTGCGVRQTTMVSPCHPRESELKYGNSPVFAIIRKPPIHPIPLWNEIMMAGRATRAKAPCSRKNADSQRVLSPIRRSDIGDFPRFGDFPGADSSCGNHLIVRLCLCQRRATRRPCVSIGRSWINRSGRAARRHDT